MQTTATHTTLITSRLRRQLESQLLQAAETLAERHKELGARIKQARDEKNWKQKELAAAVHVEPVTVSRWETGRHAPDVGMLKRIAEALGKPPSFFVAEPPNPELDERDAEVHQKLVEIERLVSEVRESMVRRAQ